MSNAKNKRSKRGARNASSCATPANGSLRTPLGVGDALARLSGATHRRRCLAFLAKSFSATHIAAKASFQFPEVILSEE